MIDFRKARYVKSAPSLLEKPDNRSAILFLGRSNVGKSTLINNLTGQKIAYSSKKAGKTKTLNYFLIEDKFYLVDAPGYGSTGFATMNTIAFAKSVESFVSDKTLRGIVLLMDLRHELGKDDVAFLKYLQGTGVPLIYVFTKTDKMNQKELSFAKRWAKENGLEDVIYSNNDIKSLLPLKGAIAKLI